MISNIEFANKMRDIATKYKTLYILGCFGAPMNAKNKKRYSANCDYNKKIAKQINAATPDTFGFDCVCLIKGVLWGWNGDTEKTYGGASYMSNMVPDLNANDFFDKSCRFHETDFSDITVGELVWMPGHIGVYIGDGLAVECTPKWDNKVQITAVGNIGRKKGYHQRTWTSHAMSKYIDYQRSVTDLAKEVIDGKWGNGAVRKRKLTAAGYDYAKVQAEVNRLLKTK